jgi:hypothetical protein
LKSTTSGLTTFSAGLAKKTFAAEFAQSDVDIHGTDAYIMSAALLMMK